MRPLAPLFLIGLAGLAGSASAQDFSSYTGAQLYQRFCSACHGPGGEGNGSVAAYFKITVPDLTQIAKRQGSFPTERIHRIIDGRTIMAPHGSREMPIWGYEFASRNPDGTPDFAAGDQLVARLVEYLRTLQK